LFTLDSAHPRGIASLDFLPAPHSLSKPKSEVLEEGNVKGTIVTGSSDATIRLFDLVSSSSSGSVEQDSETNGTAQLSTRLGELSLVPELIAPSSVSITEGEVCWTDCLCPPPMHKVNSTHCMRCWNRGHTALVRTLYLKGKLLISGGYDGTVKVSFIFSLFPITSVLERKKRVKKED
jgi:WD40 repeat protein